MAPDFSITSAALPRKYDELAWVSINPAYRLEDLLHDLYELANFFDYDGPKDHEEQSAAMHAPNKVVSIFCLPVSAQGCDPIHVTSHQSESSPDKRETIAGLSCH